MEDKLIETEVRSKIAEELSDDELNVVSGGAGKNDKTKINTCPVCLGKPTGRMAEYGIYEFVCSCGSVFSVGYIEDRPSMIRVSTIKGKPNPDECWLDINMIPSVI